MRAQEIKGMEEMVTKKGKKYWVAQKIKPLTDLSFNLVKTVNLVGIFYA